MRAGPLPFAPVLASAGEQHFGLSQFVGIFMESSQSGPVCGLWRFMAERLERLRRRAKIVSAIRRFFDEQDFVEVDTPVSLSTVAPEPGIEAPPVTLTSEGRVERRFLQTSPELPMKRLLASGLTRIYQIAPVFRDGDFTRLHRPEFRLLEWYRRDASWTSLMDDCEGLLGASAEAVGARGTIELRGQSIDLGAAFRRISVDEAFRTYAGFSILDALSTEALRAQLDRLGIHCAQGDTWADLFHRVFLTLVEPALVSDPRPLFLTHYPAPVGALARLSPDDARVAERFALYAGGMELANGYGELTDPDEQRARFERELAYRREHGLTVYPLDERFLASLGSLPRCAGIALGLERLLMLLLDAREIDGVAFVPWTES